MQFVVAGMAAALAQGMPTLSLRNGCRCVPESGVTVEDLLLIIGQKLGFENMVSASRMNKAVVVFFKCESLVNELTVSGIWVKETFVPVTPLSAPATKVTVSNVPPFISNEVIVKELLRFGKMASPVKSVPLGCKDSALKHVLSFRQNVYMFLNSPERTLEVSFRVNNGESSFMLYAITESFECGVLGHKRFTCPRRDEQRASTSRDENDVVPQVNNSEAEQAEEQDKGATEEGNGQQEVSDLNVNAGCAEQAGCSYLPDQAVSVGDEKDQSDAEDNIVQKCEAMEEMADETESLSQYTDDDMRNNERWSDVSSKFVKDLYPLEQINSFLDKTKGKSGVEIRDYFPDVEKFIASVMWFRKESSYDELSQQKIFRLKSYCCKIRKKNGKSGGKYN